jgi:hypothetical protein
MGLTIIVRNAVEAMDLKAQVQQVCGLNTFTWKFTPVVNNWLGDEVITPASVEFEFTDARWETYFQLKWTK